MNKDGCYTSVHMHNPRNADLFEDVCKDRLPSDDIFVPPQHQPVNPEDEDDVVPDQHAAFGIQRATQAVREPAWKDLSLAQLMQRGPRRGWAGPGAGTGGVGAGPGLAGGGGGGGMGSRDYPSGQHPGGFAAGGGGASASSYSYYAYYYGYNANGIGSTLASLGGRRTGAGAGAESGPGSPGGISSNGGARAPSGATHGVRRMPR